MRSFEGYVTSQRRNRFAEIEAVLEMPRSPEWPAGLAEKAVAKFGRGSGCKAYLSALKQALWEDPVPFGTELYEDMYRTAASDSQWMVMSLMMNAEQAGQEAKRLWLHAAGSTSHEERLLFKAQTVVLSQRSRQSLAFLDLAFRDAIAPSFRSELNCFNPGYSMKQQISRNGLHRTTAAGLLNDFAQINISEIRMAVHFLIQRLAFKSHCRGRELRQAEAMLSGLVLDSFRQIAGTAAYIERKTAKRPAEIRALFCECLRKFNRATSEEPIEYSYNQRFANYP